MTAGRAGRQLHLNLFVYPGGHHEAAWRYPASAPERVLDLSYYVGLARAAEAARFDGFFLADGPSLPDNIAYATRFRLEPFTLLSAIAATTTHLGLIGTASTTYSEPYNLARQFAGLDHVSGGRAGWNIVTTGAPGAAQNFGLDEHPAHADRYARADEFLDVVTALWDSWEDDAVVGDPVSGRYADTDRIHRIDHVGPHFSVRGPLNTPRTPQGRPVYVQAGTSEDGRAFAARWADAVFAAHQTLDEAQAYYADVRRRAAADGRDPDDLLVLPGISPYLGSTEAEARALQRDLDELTQPAYSIDLLRRLVGVELTEAELDQPFPVDRINVSGDRAQSSRFRLVRDLAERERPTSRALLHRLAGARGHKLVVGTPEQVADVIATWFTRGAADGFNVMPPYLTGGFTDFAEHVVPILQARGLFRRAYSGTTLREHYGLTRPASRFTTRRTAPAAVPTETARDAAPTAAAASVAGPAPEPVTRGVHA